MYQGRGKNFTKGRSRAPLLKAAFWSSGFHICPRGMQQCEGKPSMSEELSGVLACAKLLLNNQQSGRKKSPALNNSSNFCGVNIPAVASLKPPLCWLWNREKAHTISSCRLTWVGSRTLLGRSCRILEDTLYWWCGQRALASSGLETSAWFWEQASSLYQTRGRDAFPSHSLPLKNIIPLITRYLKDFRKSVSLTFYQSVLDLELAGG